MSIFPGKLIKSESPQMSKLQHRFWLLCILSSQVLLLLSQEEYLYHITDYRPENGLAGSFTNYTHKDSRGLYWIGTQNGLHRFDGREFKVFDETYGLPFNQVMEIYEDNEGWLWLYRSCQGKDKDYCYKDLGFFHHRTYEVKSFEERFGVDPPFKPTDIEFITSSPSNKKLVITTLHQTYLWTEDAQFQVLPFLNDGRNYHLIGILDDGKLGVIQRQDEKFHYCLLSPEGQKIKSTVLSGFEEYEFNRFLLGRKEIGNYNFNQYFNGTVVLGPDKIFRLNQAGDLILHEVSHFFPRQHEPAGNRHTYYDEKTQSFWASGRDGLRVINLEKKRFWGYKSDSVSRILNGISPISNQELFCDYGLYNFVNNTKVPSNHTATILRSLPELRPGGLIGKTQIHLNRLELFAQDDTGQLRGAKVKSLFDNQFFSIHTYQKRGHTFWFGTSNGLWSYDPERDSLESFQQFNQYTDFKDCYIHDIQAIGENEYWISANKGLFRWHIAHGIVAQYSVESDENFFIPVDNIYHIHQKEDNTLWLATREGLLHLSLEEGFRFKNGQHYKLFTKEEGLLGNICVAVYEDDFGFLWVATDKGLVQFDLATSDLKVYTTKEGLVTNYFREYNHFQASSGDLIFGGIDGFVSFHPKDFKDEVVSAPEVPLIIVDYEQYDPEDQQFEMQTPELIQRGEIVLQPGIRLSNLKVALADYRNAKDQRYAYRIPGYQEEWQEDQSNLFRISGLPYGNHTMEIKGKLSDGRFSSQVLTIPIRVLRPFYLQAWFIILCILSLIGLIILFLKRRTYQYEKTQKLLQSEIEKATEQIASDKKMIEQQSEELKELDKMKTRFFANVSHELRTPLTLMLAPIDATLKENKLTNFSFTNLLIAKKNGERLHNMINEILSLTKLESNQVKIKTSPVKWYNFLKSLANQFNSLAKARQIDFRFEYQLPEDIQVAIDKQKVEIILLNLLSNAFKFTPKEQSIQLYTFEENQFLVIKVVDTGTGIHPDDLPHIFNRFYQSEQANVATEGGTGIGLALVREFTQLMGGEVAVESTLENGSTFIVKIPKQEVVDEVSKETEPFWNPSNGHTPEEEALQNPQTFDKDKLTILLVEDNHDLQIFIQSLLQTKYNVILADNGQEALELLIACPENSGVDGEEQLTTVNRKPTTINPLGFEADNLPDLIISDIMMPIMDGFQLLEKLKSCPTCSRIPVIMLTARIELQDKLKALRIGVDDYLTKPFVKEELMVRIENLLKNAASREEARVEFAREEQNAEGQADPVETLVPPPNIDHEWLGKLENIILGKLGNVNLVVDDIAAEMNLSRRQFYRRIKENTGLTANQYLKTLRLTQARTFLETKEYDSVKAISYAVGFKDVVYFSRQFKKEFGKFPSEYEVEE